MAEKGPAELRSGIAAIGKDMAELWSLAAELGEDPERAIPVLDVGCVDFAGDQGAAGIDDDVALSTFDLLARIIAQK